VKLLISPVVDLPKILKQRIGSAGADEEDGYEIDAHGARRDEVGGS
jgi:hypothetical protein